MKLRTEMWKLPGERNYRLALIGVFREPSAEHDAMAAHALMQALEEKADNHEYFRDGAGYGVDRIKDRADELMREWTEGEGEWQPFKKMIQ